MSTLIKRGSIYHYQWCINGKAQRKSLKTSDLATAKRLQRAYDARLDQMKTGTASARVETVASLTQYIEAKRATLKPRSVAAYMDHIRVLQTWLQEIGVKHWHKLTPAHVEGFVAEQLQVMAPKTVDDRITVLRACLNWLWRSNRLDVIPVRQWPRIKTIAKHPGRLQHYSAEEIKLLGQYFRWRPFWPVFQFAVYTGARRDEIRNARVSDVLLGDSTIMIRSTKTESNTSDQMRAVDIAPALRPILEERMRGRSPDDLLFPEFGLHSRNWCAVQMEMACRECGIGYKRFHGLRHSYCTYLLDGGEDISRVQDAMGHKRLETTSKYLHKVRKADVTKLGY